MMELSTWTWGNSVPSSTKASGSMLGLVEEQQTSSVSAAVNGRKIWVVKQQGGISCNINRNRCYHTFTGAQNHKMTVVQEERSEH